MSETDGQQRRAARNFVATDIVSEMMANPGKVFSREDLAARYGTTKERVTANVGAWIQRHPDANVVAIVAGSAWSYQPAGTRTDPEPTMVIKGGYTARNTESRDAAARGVPGARNTREREANALATQKGGRAVKQRSGARAKRFTYVADVKPAGFLIRGDDGIMYIAKVLEVDV